MFAIRIGYFAVKYYGQHSCKKVHRQTHRQTDTEFSGLRARFVLWYDTISEVRNHPAPPHPAPPRPVPAPHPPGFQPGVAHGTQLNASVARGDTIRGGGAKIYLTEVR